MSVNKVFDVDLDIKRPSYLRLMPYLKLIAKCKMHLIAAQNLNLQSKQNLGAKKPILDKEDWFIDIPT